jgi:hypothetical protein
MQSYLAHTNGRVHLAEFLLQRESASLTYQPSQSTSTQWGGHSCAGQTYLGDAPTGTAASERKAGTRYRLTSRTSL